ncbi:MAG: tRNA (5-methylaminomethyl-2-thiouridine)(34)-methyltransferase MnmD [Flavobacteriales bacterium]|nr:tRNA (5-methylaminomethyl-2-thiouridine)(34)-methyltransferase MnmD [Flavobacteriales bacterium]
MDAISRNALHMDTDPFLTDLVTRRTGDGSLTLHSPQREVFYHSVHGAVQESTHVFIKAGLEFVGKKQVDVLEVGLGTGLNLLLTWVRCLEGKCAATYTALEPHPLAKEQLEALAHCRDLAWPGLHDPFIARMISPSTDWQDVLGGLTFRKLPTLVQEFEAAAEFDVIYFDAFAPRAQPELWTVDVFRRMLRALRPGGVLVTYCAKGDVRRAMQAAGFTVARIQGPVGKKEMLRAIKPNAPS